ncbi:MAG: AraC family transcriptional regulator [Bacteroidetes bacterium]|nr:AraC family transcriptional regulator [Bacteroidota bacterium]
MNLQLQSRNEYFKRINRVVDHIEAHLEDEHTLENLSKVAHFSPFHFHRIFTALTGETINNYVKRIRLQKAGSMLLTDYRRPVTDVAALCGFNSTAVFCRAFRSHFGKSTGEFRNYHQEQDRKNGQAERKNGQSQHEASTYFSDEFMNLNRNTNMETNIVVKEMPAMDLIYCRHVGPFDQIGAAFGKLMKWAGPRGLLKFPETKTVTVYHDDPKVVEMDKMRQSACITVDEDAKPDGEFGKMHIPGGKYVVGSFKVMPHQFGEAWDAVCRWLADSGYQPSDGYPYEFYPEEHEEGPPPIFTVEICIPVKPL